MNSLAEKIKTWVAILWIRWTGRLKKGIELGAIRKGGSGVSNALIILPEGRENSRIARYFLKSIYQIGTIDLDFLMDRSLYHSFTDSLPDGVQTYTKDDVTWFQLPRKDFVDRVLARKYQAVVDMHHSFNLSTAYLTYVSRAPLRIGFSSRFSEHFFNVEIDRKDNDFVERGYLAIQKLLNL